MLIRARQINLDDFKQVFMEKNNYTIEADRITGLSSTAITGDAKTVSGYSVNDSTTDQSIWSATKVLSEIESSAATINEFLNNKAEKSSVESLDTKVDETINVLDTKADKTEFELFKQEIIQARKGHISLLDKIEEVEQKLDQITQVNSPKGKNIPVGSVIWYAGTDAPESYAICDGRELSRTLYPDLFTVITTKFGEGDGNSTFNLPNLVGENNFIRSSGINYKVGSTQSENIIDVRESYEGSYLTDKLYLVGGKYFTESSISEMVPENITFLPCIKIEVNDTGDLPVGIINWNGTENLTDDYMICDGRELSRLEYSDLFNLIGTKFGSGNGSSTFNIPDLTTKNLFIKNSNEIGVKEENNIRLTDVKQAYEGDYCSDKLYPLGAQYFTTEVTDSELIPPSIALVPSIKVKKLSISNGVNVGAFLWFTNSATPTGFLVCDGREVSRNEYRDLFLQIGTTFGAGDGLSTFNLPDLITDNKFVRSYGNDISLGYTSVINLKDIREAYEGDYGDDKLYPIGASSFSSDNSFIELHPANMALLPCIKAMNVDSVDVVSSISTLTEAYSTLSARSESEIQFTSLEENINPIKVMNITATLKDGRQNITVNFNELEVERVNSAFINICTTSLGDEYVCDIIANVVIKDNYLIIYFKTLDEKLNNETIKASLNVVL